MRSELDDKGLAVYGSKLHHRYVGLLFAILLSLSAAISIGHTIVQYYNRDNVGWNLDSLEYLDYYYGEPVRGIVHYRILTIWLARAVPDLSPTLFSALRTDDPDWEAILKFALVNTFALAATGVLFYVYQRRLGLQPAFSLLGILAFFLSRPILQSTIPPMVDALAFLTWLLILHAMLANKLWLLGISFVLGMLNKETTMLALLVIPLTALSWPRKIRQGIILALITITYLLFRSTLFPGASTSYDFNIGLIVRWFDNFKGMVSIRGLVDLFEAFGFLWFVFGYGLVRMQIIPELRWLVWLVPILFVLIVLLSGNLGRTMFIAFPVVIPNAMFVVQEKLRPASRI
ncbi:MAG: hypothetical protein Kow0063_25950 [Anaerolineae bacterium]